MIFSQTPPVLTERERVALEASQQASWARNQAENYIGTESAAYLRGFADAMDAILKLCEGMPR